MTLWKSVADNNDTIKLSRSEQHALQRYNAGTEIDTPLDKRFIQINQSENNTYSSREIAD